MLKECYEVAEGMFVQKKRRAIFTPPPLGIGNFRQLLKNRAGNILRKDAKMKLKGRTHHDRFGRKGARA